MLSHSGLSNLKLSRKLKITSDSNVIRYSIMHVLTGWSGPTCRLSVVWDVHYMVVSWWNGRNLWFIDDLYIGPIDTIRCALKNIVIEKRREVSWKNLRLKDWDWNEDLGGNVYNIVWIVNLRICHIQYVNQSIALVWHILTRRYLKCSEKWRVKEPGLRRLWPETACPTSASFEFDQPIDWKQNWTHRSLAIY